MSTLRLDAYSSSKINIGSKLLDRRRFRGKVGNMNRLKLLLIDRLTKLEVNDIDNVSRELLKVRNFKNLNFDLLIIVYLYCGTKNFNLDIIKENFETDFKEQVEKINNLDISFKKKIDESNEYKFRQDFILYIFLILNDEADEDLEEEDIEEPDIQDAPEYGTDPPYNEAEDEYEAQME